MMIVTTPQNIKSLSTTNDGPDERGMAGAVDQRVLHAVRSPKLPSPPLGNIHSERRKT